MNKVKSVPKRDEVVEKHKKSRICWQRKSWTRNPLPKCCLEVDLVLVDQEAQIGRFLPFFSHFCVLFQQTGLLVPFPSLLLHWVVIWLTHDFDAVAESTRGFNVNSESIRLITRLISIECQVFLYKSVGNSTLYNFAFECLMMGMQIKL